MKNFPLFPVFLFICGVIVGCFLHGCGCGKQGFEEKGDTLSKKSTVTIAHTNDSTASYQPKIDFIEGGKIPDSPWKQIQNCWCDTPHYKWWSQDGSVQLIDTAAIIESYLQKVGYKDTVHTKYGFVRIYDTVTQNRIIARRVFTDFDVPLVTNTITIRDKPRGEVYIGAGGMWNCQEKLLGVGPSLMYKSKRDQVFEVGAMVNTASQLSYFAGLKFKISLRKK
jgi:hypothetical protein